MNLWISVKDGLPEEGVEVISFSPSDYKPLRFDYIVKAFDETFWACRSLSEHNRHTVTHWRPRPPEPLMTNE